jgi:hypothetical protein
MLARDLARALPYGTDGIESDGLQRLLLRTFSSIPPDAVRIPGSDILEIRFALAPEGHQCFHVFGLRDHEPVLRRLTHKRFRRTASDQVFDAVLLQFRRNHF